MLKQVSQDRKGTKEKDEGPREAYFIGQVDEENIRRLGNEVGALYRKDPNAMIKLYISSHGGIVSHALGFYDWIRINGIRLETIVLGSADSSAVTILLAGEIRKAAKHSLITIHCIRKTSSKGETYLPDDAESLAKSLAKMQAVVNQIIAEKTGRSIKAIMEQKRKDIPFTAEEAKKFGLVQEII